MGQHITASAYSHPSLFWALRGGGGGTYGIVTSVTYKTHPEVPLTGSVFAASLAPGSDEGYKKLIAEFIKMTPSLSDAGWGGFGIWLNGSLTFFGLALNVDQASANETWDPFYSYAQNLAGEGVQVQAATTIPYNSWFEWYKDYFVTPTGADTEIGSRMFSRDILEKRHDELADVFVEGGMNVAWMCVQNFPILFFALICFSVVIFFS
jgi:hypothetical protein